MQASNSDSNRYIQIFRALTMLCDLLKWYSICGLCPPCKFQCSTWSELLHLDFVNCVIYSVVPEKIFVWLCPPCNLQRSTWSEHLPLDLVRHLLCWKSDDRWSPEKENYCNDVCRYRRKYCSWQNINYSNVIEGFNFLVAGEIWRGHTDHMWILLNCNALQHIKNLLTVQLTCAI
jgi:hypothetical protein